MRRYAKSIRIVMWLVLLGLLAAWLAATVHNPRRAKTVFSVAFSPDGTLLALGTDDGTVVLVDLKSRKRLAVLNAQRFPNWTKFVKFSPDGRTLMAGGDGRDIEFWDVSSRQVLNTVETDFGTINCAVFAPDGAAIVTGSEDDT